MTGLARVYRALDAIKDNATLGNGGKIDKAVQDLINLGSESAQGEYAGSDAEGADGVRVSGSLTAQEGTVTAAGADILFVEFGTGVNLNYGSMKGGELGFAPASWSTSDEGKGFLTGKRLATFRGWWPVAADVPNGQKVTFVTSSGKEFTRYAVQGHAPVSAMLHTAEKMKQNLGAILKEAYK